MARYPTSVAICMMVWMSTLFLASATTTVSVGAYRSATSANGTQEWRLVGPVQVFNVPDDGSAFTATVNIADILYPGGQHNSPTAEALQISPGLPTSDYWRVTLTTWSGAFNAHGLNSGGPMHIYAYPSFIPPSGVFQPLGGDFASFDLTVEADNAAPYDPSNPPDWVAGLLGGYTGNYWPVQYGGYLDSRPPKRSLGPSSPQCTQVGSYLDSECLPLGYTGSADACKLWAVCNNPTGGVTVSSTYAYSWCADITLGPNLEIGCNGVVESANCIGPGDDSPDCSNSVQECCDGLTCMFTNPPTPTQIPSPRYTCVWVDN